MVASALAGAGPVAAASALPIPGFHGYGYRGYHGQGIGIAAQGRFGVGG
jgi:hypothetical protein